MTLETFDFQTAPLDSATLIEASAGTGKTYNLEQLVLRLLTESTRARNRPLSMEEILVVTYTEKASLEMKERIRSSIRRKLAAQKKESDTHRIECLEAALVQFDRAAIYTIHGFCRRLLAEYPGETGASPASKVVYGHAVEQDAVWDYFRNQSISEVEIELLMRFLKVSTFPALVEIYVDLMKKGLYQDGQCRLRPEPDGIPPLEPLMQAMEAFRGGESSIREALTHLRDRLGEVSEESFHADLARLNGTKYPPKKISEYLETLRDFANLDDLLDLLFFITKNNKGEATSLWKTVVKFSWSQIQEGLKKAHKGESLTEEILYRAVEDIISILEQSSLEKTVSLSGIQILHRSLPVLVSEVKRRKKQRRVENFNDQIAQVRDAVRNKRGFFQELLAGKYGAVLVDEFQDTDPLQWEIFRTAFLEKNIPLFLIGDPKQAIYGFRGANIETYLTAQNHTLLRRRGALRINYRSTEGLIEVVNRFFGKIFTGDGEKNQKGQIDYLSSNPPSEGSRAMRLFEGQSPAPPVEFFHLNPDEERSIVTFRERNLCMIEHAVIHLLNEETSLLSPDGKKCPVEPKHIAILADTNKQCETLRERLSKLGVPAIVSRQGSVWNTEEANAFLYFLRAVESPRDIRVLKLVLTGPFFDFTDRDLLGVERENGFEAWQDQFHRWHDRYDTGQFALAIDEAIGFSWKIHYTWDNREIHKSILPFRERWLRLPGGERVVTNVTHLAELISKTIREEEPPLSDLIQTLEQMLREPDESRDHLIRLDRDADALQIMTLHAAKGLEFPVVFFHGGMTSSSKGATLYQEYLEGEERLINFGKSPEIREKAKALENEEKLRLLYVAFTRAKSRLYLPFISGDFAEKIPLSSFYQKGMDNLPTTEELGEWIGGDGLFLLSAYDEGTYGEPPPSYLRDEKGRGELIAPPVPDKAIGERYRAMSSYSRLDQVIKRREEQEDKTLLSPVDDETETAETTGEESSLGRENIYNFSRGNLLGNLLHSLLEEIDFEAVGALEDLEEFLRDRDWDAFFSPRIISHFAPSWNRKYQPWVREILWRTLHTTLPSPHSESAACLADLEESNRRSEVEFTFPIRKTSKVNVHLKDASISDFRIDQNGFLRGFIDLIFRRGETWYLADWKSTYLGDDPDDYSLENLGRAMEKHHYSLQCALYALALYLYLERQIDDFCYERHFGGVFYFFLRGMPGPGEMTSRGVFFTCPREKDILDMRRQLVRENSREDK